MVSSDGFKKAIPYVIDERTTINIFSLCYFIASKLEAFKNRGRNDFRFSTDFEEIVYVLENAANVTTELMAAGKDVKSYLKEAFTTLLKNPGFEEGVPGLETKSLNGPQAAAERKVYLRDQLATVGGVVANT